MKGIIIIGGVVIVGFTAYGVYKYLQSKEENKISSVNEGYPAKKDAEPFGENARTFYESKSEAGDIISNRHKEAANSVKESLQTIFENEQSSTEIITNNSNTLDKIDADFDDLLK